jgi:hypothetical protein
MLTAADNRKEIRRAFLVCAPYLIIIFFLNDIDKLLYFIHSRLGNPLLVIYMFIATVIIFALFIHTIMEFRESFKVARFNAAVPVIMYLIALVNSFWSPLRISSEDFESKIIHRAYRREHYGHSLIKMRENGNMDIRYPGPLGMSDWEYGHWSSRGDTFYLIYDRYNDTIISKPDTLIVASDGLMVPLGIPADTLKVYKDGLFRLSIAKKNKNKVHDY